MREDFGRRKRRRSFHFSINNVRVRKDFPHPNDEFLIELYRDAQEQMRWRTEIELRYVEFFTYIILAVIAGMITASYYLASSHDFYYVAVFVIIFTIFLWVSICFKLDGEDASFCQWGDVVQRIWSYFECFDDSKYILGKSIICHNWESFKGTVEEGFKTKFLRAVKSLLKTLKQLPKSLLLTLILVKPNPKVYRFPPRIWSHEVWDHKDQNISSFRVFIGNCCNIGVS